MNYLKTSLGLFAAIWLTACSFNPVQTSESEQNWSFSGKMAIRNATEASSFSVDWVQTGEHYTIELSGPLGQGAVTLEGSPGEVTLRQGDDTLESYSLNALVYEATGMDLPLEDMKFWVRAMPAPDSPYTMQENDQGLVETIEQSGWNVSIYEYFQVDPGAQPRKMSFARAEDNGKLIIRQWTISTPSQ